MVSIAPLGGAEFWFLGILCVLVLGPLLIALVIGLITRRRRALGRRAPGWLADPTGRHEERYWAGSAWTDEVRDAGTQSCDRFTRDDRRPGSSGMASG